MCPGILFQWTNNEMSASLCYPHEVDENNAECEESAMVYQTASDRGNGPVVGQTFRDARFLEVYNNLVSVDYGIQEESGIVPCYEVRKPIGYALLLGCDRTPDDPQFLLIRQDLVLMEETLSDGGWVVSNPCLNAGSLNLTACNDYLNSLKDDRSLMLDKYSCFMFYYSGHGISEGLLLSDGRCIPYEEIVTRISSIPALVNKPKIFIFDSCRTAIDRKKESQGIWNYLPFNKSIDLRHNEQKMRDYPPPHTVISFSACEGMASFLDDDSGSFYTRDLSNKLKQYGKLLSFGEILTLVNGGAALLAQGAKKEQRPVTYSSLDRLLVLNCEFNWRVRILLLSACTAASLGQAFDLCSYFILSNDYWCQNANNVILIILCSISFSFTSKFLIQKQRIVSSIELLNWYFLTMRFIILMYVAIPTGDGLRNTHYNGEDMP